MPPLQPLTSFGTLQYTDGSQGGPVPVKIDINGNIDKGFFEAEGDWTCYRRNYFSCICSYSLTPWVASSPMQFVQDNGPTYSIHAFAMCISAVIAESPNKIELVQHTPKRDKGPTEEPQKVRLQPKQQQQPSQLGLYPHDNGMGPSSRMYGADPYAGGQHGSDYQTEYTFERIQFKQATANNGKRRAAQQYYHLVVELWGDVGGQGPDKYIKIAQRKSARMIVRGRSPGHYQSERRGSTSSGPGGSAGNMGSYGGPMLGDFTSGGTMLGGGGYGNNDYARTNPYGATRHHQHDIPLEALIPGDDNKVIDTHKDYLYYPGTISEGQQHPDGRGPVDMYAHHQHHHNHHQRSAGDGMLPHLPAGIEHQDRVKRDPENGLLPSLFHQTRCSPFNGKANSDGYYPAMIPQPGVNIT